MRGYIPAIPRFLHVCDNNDDDDDDAVDDEYDGDGDDYDEDNSWLTVETFAGDALLWMRELSALCSIFATTQLVNTTMWPGLVLYCAPWLQIVSCLSLNHLFVSREWTNPT